METRTAISYDGKKASEYDAKREGSNKWHKENDAVASLFPEGAKTVIDVPCGTGRFFDFYSTYGLNVMGVDVSGDMLLQARKKSQLAELRIADVRQLPKELTGKFDVAVCCRLTGWLDPHDLKLAIAELMRVARVAIIGIRTNPGEAFAKGKLWNHSHQHFLDCIKPHTVDASVVFGSKGYGFYRVVRHAN